MKQGNAYKWSFIDRVSIAVINLAVNLTLVRMLTESDFGLLAMITIFIAVASDLSSCGLSDGLIHKANPTELDYSTVFIFNSAFGLFFGLCFFFGAPFVARFFAHEELVVVMQSLGVCFFFQSMSYVQETRLRKMLRMKTVCFVRVGATLTVSALGIAAAALGYGYKALICTQIMLGFFFFVYYTIASGWFPKLRFSSAAFKEFFGYGVHLMLAYLATLIGRNINTSVLGRFYTSALSGIYYQGSKLANTPYGIMEASVNNTFFVVASNEPDGDRRKDLIRKMTSTLMSIDISLVMYMVMIATPAIALLFGAEWLAVVPVFRVLAFSEAACCYKNFFITLCKVHDRTTFVRNMGFVEVAFQLLLLLIFFRMGILWIAFTQVCGQLFSVGVYIWYCTRRLRVLRLRELLAAVWSALWLPVLAAAASFAIWCVIPASWHPFASCAVLTLAYAAVLLGIGAATGSGIYPLIREKVLKR